MISKVLGKKGQEMAVFAVLIGVILAFSILAIIYSIFTQLEQQKVVVLNNQVLTSFEDAKDNPIQRPGYVDPSTPPANAILLKGSLFFPGFSVFKKTISERINLPEECIAFSVHENLDNPAYIENFEDGLVFKKRLRVNIFFFCYTPVSDSNLGCKEKGSSLECIMRVNPF